MRVSRHQRDPARPRAGFTMVELAVTMLIVFMTLLGLLQGLSTAKFSAAQTKNMKIAQQLALETLGEVESGYYWDDMDSEIHGDFADDGRESATWYFDILFGDEFFPEDEEEDYYGDQVWHDSFYSEEDEEEEDREEQDLPFEKVRVRVTFPKLQKYKNTVVVERWIPWEQVYGPSEDEEGGGNL